MNRNELKTEYTLNKAGAKLDVSTSRLYQLIEEGKLVKLEVNETRRRVSVTAKSLDLLRCELALDALRRVDSLGWTVDFDHIIDRATDRPIEDVYESVTAVSEEASS